MKLTYSKLAIVLFGCSALFAQANNNQSVSVNGTMINSASHGGESVQTIAGKKSTVVNGTVITHNGKTIVNTTEEDKDSNINAILKGKDFSGQNLAGHESINSDLENANFSNANLSGADFVNANLQNANFSNANLQGADFTNANLENADLRGANLKDAVRINANLSGAKTQGTLWK